MTQLNRYQRSRAEDEREDPVASSAALFIHFNGERLKNVFPDDSVAVVECAKGYTRTEGSSSITCLNGTWSTVELTCQKIDCGVPTPSPHMKYRIEKGTLFGDFIQPVCDEGYDLEGSSFRQCLVSGWSGRVECTLITCEVPDQIEHGEVTFPKPVPKYNDSIEYSCHEDYILVGNRTIRCDGNGEYSSLPPECKAAGCEAPEVSFAHQTEGSPPYLPQSRVVFECWTGYRMNGAASAVCEGTHWSLLPECAEGSSEGQNITDSQILVDDFSVAVIVVVSTIGVILAVCVLLYHNSKYKGSYNTGEEQRTKEELFLYQSL
ncbi:hypothetical protein DNTS_015308 [Danionella cerebrum]|uniref:Sushi domain-containing protein n=1 Tax=Danionella cerebrum TaxID=2873325 RepID=A0A553QHG2_9TELE|nr:hypothetical protein DNTS_015308 [Danionella translucida]